VLKEASVNGHTKVIGFGELMAQRINPQVDRLFVPDENGKTR